MKRTILFIALATLLFQATKSNAQVGFYLGYAPQTLAIKGPILVEGQTVKTLYQGFFGGVHYDFDIVDNLDFAIALQIRMNSASSKRADTGMAYDTQDWQFGVDVPLLLSYDFDLGHDVALGLFAGPMLSYGISYTQKHLDPETHATTESVNRYGDKSAYPNLAMRRFEIGVAGGLFVEYKDFVLFGGYRLGFNDIDKVDDLSSKTRGFFVGIGMN